MRVLLKVGRNSVDVKVRKEYQVIDYLETVVKALKTFGLDEGFVRIGDVLRDMGFEVEEG